MFRPFGTGGNVISVLCMTSEPSDSAGASANRSCKTWLYGITSPTVGD
jgi:hypothetical protein